MESWTRLTTYTKPLERGNLVRCSIDGAPCVMMLREPQDLVVLTDSNAGTSAYTLPRDARNPRWLAENWATYIPSPVDDVAVRGDLSIDELATTPRIAIADFNAVIERGGLIECPFGYPFEGRVYMMITEVDSRLGFVAITGYKAGIRAFWVPPIESQTAFGIDSRWLVANSERWLFGDAHIDRVYVRARLTATEL